MAGVATGTDVAVVGGGVIGLAVALRAARDGLRVVVLDAHVGSGASVVAAGVLAPLTGPHDDGPALPLSRAAFDRYPAWVADIEAVVGFDTGMRATGSLAVATDAPGRAALDDLHERAARAGIAVQALDGPRARRLEPHLSTAVEAALRFPDDAQVEPRRLLTALRAACQHADVTLIAHDVRSLATDEHGRISGVHLADGTLVRARNVVLAAGVGTPNIEAPGGAVPAIRPVQGEILALRGRADLCRTIVRHVTADAATWVVPRGDGRYVIGATVRDGVGDLRVRAGGVRALLSGATAALPRVDELTLDDAVAGLRSAADDDLPIVGWTPCEGLLLATGHLRKGILEAPATADACLDLLRGRPSPFPELDPSRLLTTGARR